MPFIGIKRTFWPRLRTSSSAAADNGATTVSDNGLITIASAYSVKHTIDRVETDIKLKGLTVFARVDHAAGAMEVGLSLAPTLLLIFGNARGGTPLMQAKQQVGIDLPLKMLAWQDGSARRGLPTTIHTGSQSGMAWVRRSIRL